jgi:protein-S-isoprenylcysteine O-methyltransferase Ste14
MTAQREPVPVWAKALLLFSDKTIWEVPGKPLVKVSWAVNFHKIFTLFIIYALMEYYNNFSVAAWVYLALHGSYGYCWLIKAFGFRDHLLERKISVLGTFNLYIFLVGWYWLLPWLFISRFVEPEGYQLFIAVSLHTFGVVLMIAADGQRHWQLLLRKGLITNGVYRYTRNPNYLGEIILYFAYAYLVDHWIGWLIVAYQLLYFLARMKAKDHTISRHPGWDEYKIQSALLIPWGILSGRAIKDLFKTQAPESA